MTYNCAQSELSTYLIEVRNRLNSPPITDALDFWRPYYNRYRAIASLPRASRHWALALAACTLTECHAVGYYNN